MKKDIPFHKVKNVAVAIVPTSHSEWWVYMVNKNVKPLKTVLVNSRGFEVEDEKLKKTSTLRKNLGDVGPNSFVRIEPIMPELFSLQNEFWISFWMDGNMYDKQYIFEPGAIHQENFETIPFMEEKGIILW